MAVQADITLTCKYQDGKTRKVTLSPIATSALMDVKDRIIERNNATYRQQNYEGFDAGFVSDGGANFSNFSAAVITVTNETVIF